MLWYLKVFGVYVVVGFIIAALNKALNHSVELGRRDITTGMDDLTSIVLWPFLLLVMIFRNLLPGSLRVIATLVDIAALGFAIFTRAGRR